MPRIEKSIRIAAPGAVVWSWIDDAERFVRWSPVERFEYEGQQRGPGARFHLDEVILGRTSRYECTVTTREPERSFGFRGRSRMADIEATYVVEPEGDGCRCTIVEEIGLPGGVLGRALSMLGGAWLLGKAIENNLAKLKELAETDGA